MTRAPAPEFERAPERGVGRTDEDLPAPRHRGRPVAPPVAPLPDRPHPRSGRRRCSAASPRPATTTDALVLALWVVALVGLSVASGAVGAREPNGGGPTGTESQRAGELLKHEFPRTEAGKGSATIVFHDPAGLRSPAAQHRIDAYLASLRGTRGIGAVASPFANVAQVVPRRSDGVRSGRVRSPRRRPRRRTPTRRCSSAPARCAPRGSRPTSPVTRSRPDRCRRARCSAWPPPS